MILLMDISPAYRKPVLSPGLSELRFFWIPFPYSKISVAVDLVLFESFGHVSTRDGSLVYPRVVI